MVLGCDCKGEQELSSGVCLLHTLGKTGLGKEGDRAGVPGWEEPGWGWKGRWGGLRAPTLLLFSLPPFALFFLPFFSLPLL